MRKMTAAELRHSLTMAVRLMDKATIRGLVDKNETRRRLAEEVVVDGLVARFDGHEVFAPDPLPSPIDRSGPAG